MAKKKKRKVAPAAKKPKRPPAFGPLDVDIVAAVDLPRDRVRVTFKATLGGNKQTLVTVWDPRGGDGLAMVSVARAAGVPVERSPQGYGFKTAFLDGVTVRDCAIMAGKKKGRVRLWHPGELKTIQETGKIETEKLL